MHLAESQVETDGPVRTSRPSQVRYTDARQHVHISLALRLLGALRCPPGVCTGPKDLSKVSTSLSCSRTNSMPSAVPSAVEPAGLAVEQPV